MDLYKEIYDLKCLWIGRSLVGKVLLSFSFLLSLMSLGSLAETVYSFKGFIIIAIDFYSEITEPIRTFISELTGIDIPVYWKDLTIVFLTSCSVSYRVYNSIEDSLEREGIYWYVGLFLMGSATYLLTRFIIPFIGINKMLPLIALPLAPILYGIACNKSMKIGKAKRVNSYYVLVIYFVFACIASIREGLLRPLPN